VRVSYFIGMVLLVVSLYYIYPVSFFLCDTTSPLQNYVIKIIIIIIITRTTPLK